MVSKDVIKMLNDQITMEYEASAIYLLMATWADSQGYRGTASFMYAQAEEERMHMHKFIHFVSELGEQALVGGHSAPKASYTGIEEVFQTALEHEQKVTASIKKIYGTAEKAGDYEVGSFLKWFIDEQVEEESTANECLNIVRMAGKNNMYLADKEIGAKRAAIAKTDAAGV